MQRRRRASDDPRMIRQSLIWSNFTSVECWLIEKTEVRAKVGEEHLRKQAKGVRESEKQRQSSAQGAHAEAGEVRDR